MPEPVYIFQVTLGSTTLFALTEGAQRCGEGGVLGITQGMAKVTDAEAGIDADFMTLFDRKARSFTFGFTAVVQCADPIAAAAEALAQVTRADALEVAAVTIKIGGDTWSFAKGSILSVDGDTQDRDAVVSYKLVLTGPVT